VSPLHDDLAAWIAYSEALGSPSGGAVLRESGLTLGDLARLERHWRKRFETEPSLAKEARTLRDTEREGPLPPITLGPRGELSRAREATPTAEPEAEIIFDHDHEMLERAASLEALLGRHVGDEVLARRGLGSREEAKALVAEATARVESQPALSGFYRSRVEHHRRLLAKAVTPPRPAEALPRAPQPIELPPITGSLDHTTALEAGALDLEALPFKGDRAAPTPRSTLDDAPHEAVGETAALTLDDLGLPATPFEATRAAVPGLDRAAEPPDASVGRGSRDEPPPSASIDETSFLDASALSFDDDALPFAPDPNAAPPPPMAAELSASASIDETAALDVGLLSLDALPFEGGGPGSFATNDIHTDVQRYASYRTELRRGSDEAGIRARYGVPDEAAHLALVAAWDRRFTTESRLAAEYVATMRAYGAWLDQHGDPSR
jgi:hypothetical protein